VVYGGVDIKQQLAIVRAALRSGRNTGRLLDHIEQRASIWDVEIFVLMKPTACSTWASFDISGSWRCCPVTPANLLFSATFSVDQKARISC
jgi:hypothetical protein